MLREIALLLCYEVTRDLSLDPVQIETPLMPMQAQMLAGKKLVFAPILRAGMGFIEGMLDLCLRRAWRTLVCIAIRIP